MLTNNEGAGLVAMCNYIATQAHYGQFRRDGKTPYINHPQAVAARLKTSDEKAVGYLHDVIEDTNLTAQDLLDKGVPERIVDGVIHITKEEGESYMAYLIKVAGNRLSKAAKIEDMLHNLSDSPTRQQIVKYAKGLIFLLED